MITRIHAGEYNFPEGSVRGIVANALGEEPEGVILEGPVTVTMPCGQAVTWGEGEHALSTDVLCPCGKHVAIVVQPLLLL